MKLKWMFALLGVLVAVGVYALVAQTRPAAAAATTFNVHLTRSVVGDVFPCTGGDLTITSGTVAADFTSTLDADGVYHLTFTGVPRNVTLTDGQTTYYLSGASSGQASGSDPDNGIVTVETDAFHRVIRAADGGVYGRVSLVAHVSPNGSYFELDTGTCNLPG